MRDKPSRINAMASKRARKHRAQVKQEQAQKQQQRTQQPQAGQGKRSTTVKAQSTVFSVPEEVRKQIARANARLRRLVETGIQNEIYTLTVNTLGQNRFPIPRSPAELTQIVLVLGKFLDAPTSKVKQAKAVSTKNKADFAEFLRRANQGKLSESAIDIAVSRLGDLNLGELIKSYIYKEIVDAVVELENSGIDTTSANVTRALSADIDSVIEDEFARRGVDVPFEIMSDSVSIARTDSIEIAIDYIEKYKKGKEEEITEQANNEEQINLNNSGDWYDDLF